MQTDVAVDLALPTWMERDVAPQVLEPAKLRAGRPLAEAALSPGGREPVRVWEWLLQAIAQTVGIR